MYLIIEPYPRKFNSSDKHLTPWHYPEKIPPRLKWIFSQMSHAGKERKGKGWKRTTVTHNQEAYGTVGWLYLPACDHTPCTDKFWLTLTNRSYSQDVNSEKQRRVLNISDGIPKREGSLRDVDITLHSTHRVRRKRGPKWPISRMTGEWLVMAKVWRP